MIRNTVRLLVVVAGSCWLTSANATYSVSNALYSSNSLTFTIDGDMTGYATPADQTQFSIRMPGDIFIGPANGLTPNMWSASPFDNESISFQGNLFNGPGTVPYSWTRFTNSLVDSFATNNTVTVSWAESWLDVNATDPILEFVWGNGRDDQIYTLIATVHNPTPVPAPGALALFGTGLALLWLRRRTRR